MTNELDLFNADLCEKAYHALVTALSKLRYHIFTDYYNRDHYINDFCNRFNGDYITIENSLGYYGGVSMWGSILNPDISFYIETNREDSNPSLTIFMASENKSYVHNSLSTFMFLHEACRKPTRKEQLSLLV